MHNMTHETFHYVNLNRESGYLNIYCDACDSVIKEVGGFEIHKEKNQGMLSIK